MKHYCPICHKCDLFKGKIELSEDISIMYKYHYCLNESYKWKECKRYIFHNINGSCPDFVMPNSLLSIDEIWQKAQKEFSPTY